VNDNRPDQSRFILKVCNITATIIKLSIIFVKTQYCCWTVERLPLTPDRSAFVEGSDHTERGEKVGAGVTRYELLIDLIWA
jgi:hypothetical protein